MTYRTTARGSATLVAWIGLQTLLCAQFQSIPDSNASWIDHWESWDLTLNESNYYYLDSQEHDTLVNDTLYSALYGFSESDGVGSWPPEFRGGLYDNGEGQVYYFDPNTSTSNLLYDFSLQVGDSSIVWSSGLLQTMYVAAVDTVDIAGIGHRALGVQSIWAILGGQGIVHWWIQGIGGTGGLLSTSGNDILDVEGGLQCMASSDTLWWYWGVYGEIGSCIALGIEEPAAGASTGWFYPSLVDDELIITAPCSLSDRIDIYALDGRELSSLTLQENRVSMASLSAGSYIVRMRSRIGSVYTGRFIKQ